MPQRLGEQTGNPIQQQFSQLGKAVEDYQNASTNKNLEVLKQSLQNCANTLGEAPRQACQRHVRTKEPTYPKKSHEGSKVEATNFLNLSNAFEASIARKEIKSFLLYTLGNKALVNDFKKASFPERCNMLADAISAENFSSEDQKCALGESFFSGLPNECVMDTSQIVNLLKAIHLASSIGQGMNSYEIITLENVTSIIQGVCRFLKPVLAENVNIICLQCLKLLEESPTLLPYQKTDICLTFAHVLSSNYAQFGFTNEELAKKFAFYVALVYHPTIECYGQETFFNSITLEAGSNFLSLYRLAYKKVSRVSNEEVNHPYPDVLSEKISERVNYSITITKNLRHLSPEKREVFYQTYINWRQNPCPATWYEFLQSVNLDLRTNQGMVRALEFWENHKDASSSDKIVLNRWKNAIKDSVSNNPILLQQASQQLHHGADISEELYEKLEAQMWEWINVLGTKKDALNMALAVQAKDAFLEYKSHPTVSNWYTFFNLVNQIKNLGHYKSHIAIYIAQMPQKTRAAWQSIVFKNPKKDGLLPENIYQQVVPKLQEWINALGTKKDAPNMALATKALRNLLRYQTSPTLTNWNNFLNNIYAISNLENYRYSILECINEYPTILPTLPTLNRLTEEQFASLNEAIDNPEWLKLDVNKKAELKNMVKNLNTYPSDENWEEFLQEVKSNDKFRNLMFSYLNYRIYNRYPNHIVQVCTVWKNKIICATNQDPTYPKNQLEPAWSNRCMQWIRGTTQLNHLSSEDRGRFLQAYTAFKENPEENTWNAFIQIISENAKARSFTIGFFDYNRNFEGLNNANKHITAAWRDIISMQSGKCMLNRFLAEIEGGKGNIHHNIIPIRDMYNFACKLKQEELKVYLEQHASGIVRAICKTCHANARDEIWKCDALGLVLACIEEANALPFAQDLMFWYTYTGNVEQNGNKIEEQVATLLLGDAKKQGSTDTRDHKITRPLVPTNLDIHQVKAALRAFST